MYMAHMARSSWAEACPSESPCCALLKLYFKAKKCIPRFTPGPLTVSGPVKQVGFTGLRWHFIEAMLVDYGSRDKLGLPGARFTRIDIIIVSYVQRLQSIFNIHMFVSHVYDVDRSL